jgi:hypothetical protein
VRVENLLRSVLLRALALLIWAAPAFCLADPIWIPHSNVVGTHVTYGQISENSTTNNGATLYGQPTASGDTAAFDWSALGVWQINEGDPLPAMIDGTLRVSVAANSPGIGITKLGFVENGDYRLFNNASKGGSAFASIDFSMPVAEIREVDGHALATPITISTAYMTPPSGNMAFTNDGLFELSPGSFKNTGVFSGTLSLDVAGALAAAGQHGKATLVMLEFDNTLFANGDLGTTSYIKKKGLTLSATTTPEPSALLLLGIAVSGLAAYGRRQRNKEGFLILH